MTALMIGLALLAAWAIVAAIVTASRDGYRAVPDRALHADASSEHGTR